MKLKSLLILLGAVLILGLAVAGCSSQGGSPDAQTGPQVGKLAPDFTLPALNGQEVSLSDLRGKPVLLNFWGTWCPPCRIELPYLISAYKGYADKELVVLAVDVGENPSKVADFVVQMGVSLSVLLDLRNEVARLYQIGAFPTNFLIDRQGVIQEVRIGAFRDAMDVAASLRKIID